MRHAIELARGGAGRVSPNPLVGCVVVRDNDIIAEGFHEQYGSAHAEINAINTCAASELDGATMYVTLEPCAHYGKQPPCAEAIAKTSISRVVVGCADPNPMVSGKGLDILRDAGKEVALGIEQESCMWLARYFLYNVTNGLPYVVAKIATSLDGKISTGSDAERWLTNEESRAQVHVLRSELDAVMVGVGTIIADDPLLNVRHGGGRDPIRVIIDPECRIPDSAHVVRTINKQRTIIIASSRASTQARITHLCTLGAEVVALDSAERQIPPLEIARALFERGIRSVLLEGGPVTLDNFMRAKLVQEVHIHEAQRRIGSGRAWAVHLDPTTWQLLQTEHVGTDIHTVYVQHT